MTFMYNTTILPIFFLQGVFPVHNLKWYKIHVRETKIFGISTVLLVHVLRKGDQTGKNKCKNEMPNSRLIGSCLY